MRRLAVVNGLRRTSGGDPTADDIVAHLRKRTSLRWEIEDRLFGGCPVCHSKPPAIIKTPKGCYQVHQCPKCGRRPGDTP